MYPWIILRIILGQYHLSSYLFNSDARTYLKIQNNQSFHYSFSKAKQKYQQKDKSIQLTTLSLLQIQNQIQKAH